MNDSNLQAAQEAFASALLPIALLAVVLFIGLFLVVGYSMKFALAVAGAGKFGFWKSIGIVFATTMASSFVSMAIMLAMTGEPIAGLIACVFSIGTYVMIISAISHCSVGRSVATYFLNGIFSAIGMIPLAMILVVGVMIISSTSNLSGLDFEKFKSDLANSRGNVAGESFGSVSGEPVFENSMDGFEVQQVSGQGFGYGYESGEVDSDAASSSPQQLPSVMPASDSSGGLFDQFFTDEKTSPYPTPTYKECQGSCPNQPPKPPKRSSPVSSGVQSNPFAK
ncbi:hypothetical protein SH528x_000977 [Novipirellula sp. SH528]|uniref:hypothetical protein n=1 Tax=Novipirellula sp. SH528 TaxID=3454466 RepID=UPI003F9EFEA2